MSLNSYATPHRPDPLYNTSWGYPWMSLCLYGLPAVSDQMIYPDQYERVDCAQTAARPLGSSPRSAPQSGNVARHAHMLFSASIKRLHI